MLTLNIGTRYEFATPQWEKENRISNYDPVANGLIQASDSGMYERSLVQPDRNNWSPRIGLAYQVTDRTVLRPVTASATSTSIGWAARTSWAITVQASST